MVIDLASSSLRPWPLLRHVDTVVVAARGQPVDSDWLTAVVHERVTLIVLDQAGLRRWNPLLETLDRLLLLRQPVADLTSVILMRHPWLTPISDLVEVILAYPWEIRRARDLARLSSHTLEILKRRCGQLGMARVEHMITITRWVAYAYLTIDRELPKWRARLLVGIANASNFKRQLERARRYTTHLT